jgi:AAA15 family ATPase/GTPase
VAFLPNLQQRTPEESTWMIIDITFSNYRSFKDEQFFSLAAEKGLDRHTNNFATHGKFGVLKTAAIFGANASGKSNLLKAIAALQWVVLSSGDLKEGQDLPPYEPFLLDESGPSTPVKIEIEFSIQEDRFRYSLSFDRKRIIAERLVSYATRQKALIFERSDNDTWETIRFGSSYRGGARRIPFFANNSYLSKAGNNAAAPESIRRVYRYFRTLLMVEPHAQFPSAVHFRREQQLIDVANILTCVDTGIARVTYEEKEISSLELPDWIPDQYRKAIYDENKYKFVFWHKDSRGKLLKFDEEFESMGTRRLFNLLPMLIEGLINGYILLMDEIESSFHPHIVALIVRLFNDQNANRSNAQLVFTTHTQSVLTPELFRRDQIWFTEKRDGYSRLFSLDEYDKKQVRPDSPFGYWYDDGRFGALPNINYPKIIESLEKARAAAMSMGEPNAEEKT